MARPEPVPAGSIIDAFPNLEFQPTSKSGAEGRVFHVRTDSGEDCALKLYQMSRTLTCVERIEREVEALSRLKSPHLVRLTDSGRLQIEGEECLWTLTDYIHGTDLDEALDAGPLPMPKCEELLSALYGAIEDLWSLRIVHRDIKPPNIMQSPNADFVVVDLGIAKHLDERTITEYGHTLGTIGYMSPEQARGRPNLTLKSDVFSAGIVVYMAATGEHPFQYDQRAIMTEDPVCPSEIADVPEPIAETIMRMLSKRPIERPLTLPQ